MLMFLVYICLSLLREYSDFIKDEKLKVFTLLGDGGSGKSSFFLRFANFYNFEEDGI